MIMIQTRSIVNVVDNSGVKKIMVIGVVNRSNRRYATIGDIVTASVKEASPTSMISKHQLVKAVIVRTRKEKSRLDGSYIRFDDNAAIIIDNPKDKNPKGTRIFGPIAKEIKDLGFNKIASLAKEVY